MATWNNDLFEEFAKSVNQFSPGLGHYIAKDFAKMAATNGAKSGSFESCESNTWNLLSILTKHQEKSRLSKLCAIKEWVSQLPKDQELLDLIAENEDVEDEINNLFKRNRIPSHDEETPRKKKRRSRNGEGDDLVIDYSLEEVYQKQYEKLRANDLTPVELSANQNVSHNYLLNLYIKYQKDAASGDITTIVKRERDIWKTTVKHHLETGTFGTYKTAVYNIMAGNASALFNTVCKTWEDTVWATINKEIEDALDQLETESTNNIVSANILSVASKKDIIMSSNDPRIIFHLIQSAIISNTVSDVLKKIHLSLCQKSICTKSDQLLKLSDDPNQRAHLLRFLSTMILFGNEYLGWKEDEYSTGIMSAYSDINSQEESLRPKVIVTYASKQSSKQQIQLYSKFLQNFDGDDEERMILISLGRNHGLNMQDVLQHTYTHLFKKAAANAPIKILDAVPKKNKFETQGEITKEYEPFFAAIKWLTYDENMCTKAIQAANETIRYFFGISKIYLVEKVFELCSHILVGRMFLEAEGNELSKRILDEYRLHRSLSKSIIDYDDWNQLMNEQPKDSGSYADLLSVYEWKDKVEKQSMRLDTEINRVLEGDWLGKDFEEIPYISNNVLRQMYIPEILIRYHKILSQSSDIIPSNKEKSDKMSVYIANDHQSLLDDVTSANRIRELIEQLSNQS